MGVKSLAPYVRSTHSLRHMMLDVILVCLLYTSDAADEL